MGRQISISNGWWLLAGLALPAAAQDSVARVQVEGLEELKASVRRLEERVSQLTASRWEYRFVGRNVLTGGDGRRQVEALGQEGWELVDVTVEEGFILKRRLLR